jgi:hypothetical protein
MPAQLLEGRIRGRVHEGLEGVEARNVKLGRIPAPMGFGGDIAGSAIAGEEITDTT